MSYTRTTWQPGVAGNTKITAARLNNMEQGIVDAQSAGASDPNIAALVANPSSQTAVQLSNTIAAAVATKANVPGAPVIATVGDSITAMNTSYLQCYSRLGPALAGDRLQDWRVFATAGFTLDQIRTTHLPSVLAMNPLPRFCLIAGGTNDMVTYDLNATIATLKLITDALVQANITPILWCPPPRSSDPANDSANRNTAEWSAYIRGHASDMGWRVLDANTLLSDPTTGAYDPTYIPAQQATPGDGIHPNILGHLKMARAYATIIRSLYPVPTTALLTNPRGTETSAGVGLFLTDTNSDGLADGVSNYGSAPGTVVAGAPVGKWQRKAISAGSTSPGGLRIEFTGLVAGHEYDFGYVVNASLDGPGGSTAAVTAAVTSTWRTAAAQIAGVGPGVNDNGQHTAQGLCMLTSGDFVYVYFRALAPATATNLRTDIVITGTAVADGWVQVGQLTIRDRTALGLPA